MQRERGRLHGSGFILQGMPISLYPPVLYYPEIPPEVRPTAYFYTPTTEPMKFFYLLTVLLPSLVLAQGNAPKNLRCEHEAQPLGLDERQPRLS